MSKPVIKEFQVWDPGAKPITILISGAEEIYTLFEREFSQYQLSPRWSPKQPVYNYGFYVNGAKPSDIPKFEDWLKTYQITSIEPFRIDNSHLRKLYALGYHGSTQLAEVVNIAKPYGDKSKYPMTNQQKESASYLVDNLAVFITQDDDYKHADFMVAVPCLNKSYDLPRYLTQQLAERTGIPNGSHFVTQIREKEQEQKELESIIDKRQNVRGIFKVSDNHPFQNKVVTIIDDIYRSGATINEVARILKKVGATVQALVVTKTMRD